MVEVSIKARAKSTYLLQEKTKNKKLWEYKSSKGIKNVENTEDNNPHLFE